MSFEVTVESTLERDWRNFTRSAVRGIHRAVQTAIEDGVGEAKRVRTFKDRTGDLYRSIVARMWGGEDALGAEGTMEATAPYASFVENGTRAHIIEPKRRKMLAWFNDARDEAGRFAAGRGVIFAHRVQHPGTRPMPFMGPAYLKAQAVLEAQILVAIEHAQKSLP